MGSDIIRYYDSNTLRFLRFGHGRGKGAIHRAVWAEGVTTRDEAIDYVHTLIREVILDQGACRILDIGCGIGGSMTVLAGIPGTVFQGITISPVQVRIGRRYLQESGCADSCGISEGDFLEIETESLLNTGAAPGRYDLCYAVESFLHMKDPDEFFRKAAVVLSPGGRLLICDDFLVSGDGEGAIEQSGARNSLPNGSGSTIRMEDQARRILLERFQKGWHVTNLLSGEAVNEKARRYGFQQTRAIDLSPYLELRRPRDRLISFLMFFLGGLPLRAPFWQNMQGGDALQKLLLKGTLQYCFLGFEKKR